MRAARRRGAAVAIAAIGCVAAPARAGVLHTWPGAAPCDGTLQACVDAAGPGDTVEVATAGPIDEAIYFAKPLTLRAQSGVSPQFVAGRSVLGGLSGGASGTVAIEGLTLADGAVSIFQASSGALTARIAGVTVLNLSGGPALEIYTSSGTGVVSASVLGGRVSVPITASQTDGISVSLGSTPAGDVTVARNQIQMGGNSQGAAIAIAASGGIDVIGNEISGAGFDQGISYDAQDGGTVRVFDNVVFGQAGNVGNPGAIAIDGNDATSEILIGQNTLVNDEEALSVGARSDLGGSLEGGIVNNIIVGCGNGLVRDLEFAASVPDHHNLFFDDGVDVGTGESPETPGPGSVFADPELDGDLRPLPGSPAIDAGDTSFVPQDLATDVFGGPRIVGAAVDIGAHEVPEPGAAPSAALVALASLRRRRAQRACARGGTGTPSASAR